MVQDIVLREITEEDLPWALQLRNKNKEFFFDNQIISQEAQQAWFRALNTPFYIIEYNGEKAGTIGLKKIDGKLEFRNVIIDEPYRKMGILKYAIAFIEEKYNEPLYLNVLIDNVDAMEAYKKLGFIPIAIRMRKQ